MATCSSPAASVAGNCPAETRPLSRRALQPRPSSRQLVCSVSFGSLAAVLAATLPAPLCGQDVKQTNRAVKPPARPDSKTTASPLDEPLRLAQKAREKFRTIQDFTGMLIKRE